MRLRDERVKVLGRFAAATPTEVQNMAHEIGQQRNLMGELYQVLGALNAPYAVLDRVLEASEGTLSSESLLPFDAPKLQRRGRPVNETALEGAKEVSAADEAYYRSMGRPSLEEAWKKYSERAIVNGAIIANELLRLSRDDNTE